MSDGGDSAVPLEEKIDNANKNDVEKLSRSPNEKTKIRIAIPRLAASTPLSKFDKTRLDLEAVQIELNKLVPPNQPNFGENSSIDSIKYSDDTTLIEYHTPTNTTPYNSTRSTPEETTPRNVSPETVENPVNKLFSLKGDTLLNKTNISRPNSLENLSLNLKSNNSSINQDTGSSIKTELPTKMALTSAQYSDIIPSCKDVKDVEQFVTIVDKLHKEAEENKKKVFLAITGAKITGKAFDAIKGKDTSTWELLKNTLTKGLEEKVDMSTASNKLTHIKQLPNEQLKEYVERIKDALAVLNRTAIRQFTDEAVKTQILALNDATAKNTFEAGLIDMRLKTVVVAAQRETFNDSYNFATNQQHTNFPMKKVERDEKKANSENKINCFKCGKPNHYANECYANSSRIRSRSLPNRYDNFRSFNMSTNNFRNNPNANNFRNNSYVKRNFGGTSNSYSNQDNRPNISRTSSSNGNLNGSLNGNLNGNGNNNKKFWPKPSFSQNNIQNRNSNFSNFNTNRNTQNNNRALNSNRNTIRVIRENEVDWNEIVPLYENVHVAGNEQQRDVKSE